MKDNFQLAIDLSKIAQQPSFNLQKVLKDYENKRKIHVGWNPWSNTHDGYFGQHKQALF